MYHAHAEDLSSEPMSVTRVRRGTHAKRGRKFDRNLYPRLGEKDYKREPILHRVASGFQGHGMMNSGAQQKANLGEFWFSEAVYRDAETGNRGVISRMWDLTKRQRRGFDLPLTQIPVSEFDIEAHKGASRIAAGPGKCAVAQHGTSASPEVRSSGRTPPTTATKCCRKRERLRGYER